MSLLDRYIFRSLMINYLIALAVMMSLYVVLDLQFNFDEFTEAGESTREVLAGIASYYGHNLFLYFAQLSGVITLFACLATVARMRRMNEMTAILASGVSLYRLAVPVIAFGVLTNALWFIDTEVCIPAIAHKLARRHDDAQGKRTYGVWFLRDRGGAMLSARQFDPTAHTLHGMIVVYRDEQELADRFLSAARAEWKEDENHVDGGYWLLSDGVVRTRKVRQEQLLGPQETIVERDVYAYQSNFSPEDIQLRQATQWVQFVDSSRLNRLLEEGEVSMERVLQVKHRRFTTPVVNMVLLLLGLPFFLDRTPGYILRDSTRCLLVCGLCFLSAFAVQNIGLEGRLAALPSWVPIIVFAPVAVVLLDRIRT